MATVRTYRLPWAELLRKVFALDVLACPKCSGRMQLIAFIASALFDSSESSSLGVGTRSCARSPCCANDVEDLLRALEIDPPPRFLGVETTPVG